MGRRYYDIDDILAEGCSIPCTNLFPFATLSHLDEHNNNTTSNTTSSNTSNTSNKRKYRHSSSNNISTVLEEGTSLQLPLWAIRRWGELNFIRIHMPRQYGRRTRERLMADPANADLRTSIAGATGQLYYTSGLLVCEWIERSVMISSSAAAKNNSKKMSAMSRASFAELQREVLDVRLTLLNLYTGQRLRRSLDWSMSSVGQDVSHFTRMLTDCELKLFYAGLHATKARYDWKAYGSKRIPVSKIMTRWNHIRRAAATVTSQQDIQRTSSRAVSPDSHLNR